MVFSEKIKKCLFTTIFLLFILCIVALPLISTVGATTVAPPTVTKTASPNSIYNSTSGATPINSTVNITVTGAGNITTVNWPIDVCYSIDNTGSMVQQPNPSDPNGLRFTAVEQFNGYLNSSNLNNGTNDMAAYNTWNTSVIAWNNTTSNFAALNTSIKAIPTASGSTNLNIGLNESISLLNNITINNASRVSNKVIIFLTDGDQTSGTYDPSIAKRAGQLGYPIYSIGLGTATNISLLQQVASDSGGTYYAAPTASNLSAIYASIYSKITSTVPYNVNITEIVSSNFTVNNTSIQPTPKSIVKYSNGTEIITWNNISAPFGTAAFSSNETVNLSFNVNSSTLGYLGVDVLNNSTVNGAIITYKNDTGQLLGYVNIPQANITVNQPRVSISVVKIATPQTYTDGQSVTYQYTVTNTGETLL